MTTGLCATCGTPIAITARHPRKRYCSPRCRVADWHRHHDDRPPPSTMDDTDAVPDRVPRGTPSNGVPDDVPTYPASTDRTPTGYATNGDQRCPHCRAPIAIIAILVLPTAAHVRTPEVITTSQ